MKLSTTVTRNGPTSLLVPQATGSRVPHFSCFCTASEGQPALTKTFSLLQTTAYSEIWRRMSLRKHTWVIGTSSSSKQLKSHKLQKPWCVLWEGGSPGGEPTQGEPTHSSFKANGALRSTRSSSLTHGFWCKKLKCSTR